MAGRNHSCRMWAFWREEGAEVPEHEQQGNLGPSFVWGRSLVCWGTLSRKQTLRNTQVSSGLWGYSRKGEAISETINTARTMVSVETDAVTFQVEVLCVCFFFNKNYAKTSVARKLVGFLMLIKWNRTAPDRLSGQTWPRRTWRSWQSWRSWLESDPCQEHWLRPNKAVFQVLIRAKPNECWYVSVSGDARDSQRCG